MMLDRRNFVIGSAALGGATLAFPYAAMASAATNKRLLFVIQRGAADGLATLAPMADPAFETLRAELLTDHADAPLLDGMFALHPALEAVGSLFAKREALFVHAAASSYRERSHFDGQNLLESGGTRAYQLRDGWLNRLLGLLPEGRQRALALSPAIPLALRGQHAVSSYAPSGLPSADDELLGRVARLYDDSDPQLGALFSQALKTREMAAGTDARNLRDGATAGALAAALMKGADGARILMIESNGWDTHSNQRGVFRRNAAGLDKMLAAFRDSLGDTWSDTLAIVVTEFGRAVAQNGTGGTDHGTAAAMMLLGGTVAGGQIVADWPGLRQSDLYQGRDLRPTGSTEAVLAGAVAQHFALDPAQVMQVLFPGRNVSPVEGLLRA